MLDLEIDYPESLSRLLIFVKFILVIPHLIILSVLGFAVWVLFWVAGLIILVTGRFNRTLWDFFLLYLQWTANVNAYLFLQRDEYPPFGRDETYPVRLSLAEPDSLSRWKIFVKWLFVIPAAIAYAFVSLAAFVAVIIAWFAILITGRYPRGAFDFVTGVARWGYRISAYTLLMTDRYPPFSLR